MTENPTNQDLTLETVIKTGSRRYSRYALALKCRRDHRTYQRGVLGQRLRRAGSSVEDAVKAAVAISSNGLGEGEWGKPLLTILASVGVTVVAPDGAASGARGGVCIRVEPALLRKKYPWLPRKEPHTFTCSFSLDECEGDDSLPLEEMQSESRYLCGLSEEDELRMQVEILRQPLSDVGITINEALDELCAGLQSPCEQARARCNAIVAAIERYGLRFYAVGKSWRLPRAGALLIERPEDLTRACPSLAFFEPQQFRHLLIVDRLERAGRDVGQGLLF